MQADTFFDMFEIEPDDLDMFAIACCEEQIESIYGDWSLEWLHLENAINSDSII